MTQSLFGFLVNRFSSHPENLATEALNYILNQSHVAREALVRYVSASTNTSLGEGLRFSTQVAGDDKAIPDLVGVDLEQQQVLIVEAKFWAGLTENQPITYLKRLPLNRDAVLLFVAPGKRFVTLWPELRRRCTDKSMPIDVAPIISNEFKCGRIGGRRVMALVSWSAILRIIKQALESEGQLAIAADVAQLDGLCAQMDTEAFLPLRSEELTSAIGTRIGQYCGLVDDVTATLVSMDLASTRNLRSTAKAGVYGAYMVLPGQYGAFLQVNAEWWSKYRETPLWLSLKDVDGLAKWSPANRAEKCLITLALENPPRAWRVGDELIVPLYLPADVERDVVLRALVSQMQEIIGLLNVTTIE